MKLKLSLSLTAALAVAAFTGQAATPPAQDLLPSDTLVMATLPDWDAFQEKNGKSAASGLIGSKVTGLADDASSVDGIVDRITVETSDENNSRSVKVRVGDKTMDIKNIREIQTG